MNLEFSYAGALHTLVARSSSRLGVDGPVRTTYWPGDQSFSAVLGRRLTPLGSLAIDLIGKGMDGRMRIALTRKGYLLVFTPLDDLGGDAHETFTRLVANAHASHDELLGKPLALPLLDTINLSVRSL